MRGEAGERPRPAGHRLRLPPCSPCCACSPDVLPRTPCTQQVRCPAPPPRLGQPRSPRPRPPPSRVVAGGRGGHSPPSLLYPFPHPPLSVQPVIALPHRPAAVAVRVGETHVCRRASAYSVRPALILLFWLPLGHLELPLFLSAPPTPPPRALSCPQAPHCRGVVGRGRSDAAGRRDGPSSLSTFTARSS